MAASDAVGKLFVEEALGHYGIKGMKWGFSKRKGTSGPASEDAAKASTLSTRVKSSGTKNLSNKELQELVTRMNLESQYSRLSGTTNESKISAGAKFAAGMLSASVKNAGQQMLNEKVKTAMEQQLGGKKK